MPVCHRNSLKPYFSPVPSSPISVVSAVSSTLGDPEAKSSLNLLMSSLPYPGRDDLLSENIAKSMRIPSHGVYEECLENSKMPAKLAQHISHLSDSEIANICELLE